MRFRLSPFQSATERGDGASLRVPLALPCALALYSVPVLRHVNLLRWTDGTEQAAIDALCEHLSGYPGEVPEIRGLSFGPDLGLAQNNVDFCIVVDFEDEEAFSRYLAHPAHDRMVGEFLKPILEARHAIQFHV